MNTQTPQRQQETTDLISQFKFDTGASDTVKAINELVRHYISSQEYKEFPDLVRNNSIVIANQVSEFIVELMEKSDKTS